MSSYTASHKKSYEKRRATELVRMLNYYNANKERISAMRKEKYRQKKLLAAQQLAENINTVSQVEQIISENTDLSFDLELAENHMNAIG